ncbi:hypothetical protein HETIRDRAFT_323246 [Heterobasidion irregulare TC 32-1]|uniref:Post-SET domain-containing protein n=1 Tax=Heterobasidion irregulare (strain TC 32-1) TaxID=747525 RepID=W4K1T6_HETIT|nr:uncharacterized protein HETIRDRAFT_323246 [Heterobasidion irregulare TC 32-1]ETW79066.1 hypothetical protein HETIRDRAFT_323246 [Heterobasidion irregulare TC 32-1]
MTATRESYEPSHPGLFSIEFKEGEYSSALFADKDFAEGQVLAFLEGLTKGPKAYSSVQCGPNSDDHIELNSDLLYVNHSCEPNVAFDLSSTNMTEWQVRALKPIRSGEPLSFFYPSTEWDMGQPFECICGTSSCLGQIQGAAYLSKEDLLARKFVSPWILALAAERDASLVATHQTGPGGLSAQSSQRCVSCGFGFTARGDKNLCGCRPN